MRTAFDAIEAVSGGLRLRSVGPEGQRLPVLVRTLRSSGCVVPWAKIRPTRVIAKWSGRAVGLTYAPETRFVFIGPGRRNRRSSLRRPHPQIVELPAVDVEENNAALAACTLFSTCLQRRRVLVWYFGRWHYYKPVIAADIGITHELVSDGIDGFIVTQTPGDCSRHHSPASPQLCAELGAAGYRKQMADYTWEQSVRSYLVCISDSFLQKKRLAFNAVWA